jgi:Holliday junction resolvase RusA-like endonuclease
MITFTASHVPVAQPRQRHAIRGSGDKAFASNYTPVRHPVNAFKVEVRIAAKEAYAGLPLLGPLSVRLSFVMPRPKKFNAKKYSTGRLWFDRKPDADNLFKSVADALNGLAYHDDSQIVVVHIYKHYAAVGELPHVEVTIKEIV